MISIELGPGRQWLPARTFQILAKIPEPGKILSPETEHILESPFHVGAVQQKVRKRCQKQKQTGKGVRQF